MSAAYASNVSDNIAIDDEMNNSFVLPTEADFDLEQHFQFSDKMHRPYSSDATAVVHAVELQLLSIVNKIVN